MKELLLKTISTQDYDLNSDDFTNLDDRTVVVKKWFWDYPMAHAFQKRMVDFLQVHPRSRVLICCNHTRVLTNGRGLQKAKKGETLDLVDFNPKNYSSLPFPLVQIERGGGLTFHHPGQFIFYPILKLNPQTLSLSKMIDEIFEITKDILNDYGLEGLTHQHKLLGLWLDNKKIASMGIAIEKLTTFHGMALNLIKDEEMKKALQVLNPCGLSADTYYSVEELITKEKIPSLDQFCDEFIKRIHNAWK
jgi:lipoyl(octanoyl) transferase